jgi:hypothetical protein
LVCAEGKPFLASPVERGSACGDSLSLSYTLAELDERLRAGQLELPIWQSEVVGFIEAHWGKLTARFARIIAVGGGILLLGNYLSRRFPNLWIPDEPLLSQARGLYKYALSKERKTAEAGG